MSIDHSNFTPLASLIGGLLIGGLLIGLSATIPVLGVGRIAGISSVVGTALQSLTRGSLRGQAERLVFLRGQAGRLVFLRGQAARLVFLLGMVSGTVPPECRMPATACVPPQRRAGW